MNFLKHIPYTAEYQHLMISVEGRTLKRGDLIVIKGESRTITRVVVKVKNVEVYHMPEGFVGYDPAHPKVTWRVDHFYSVARKFETETSKAVGLRHWTLEQLWLRADKAKAARDAAKAKFDEQWASGHAGHWEYEKVLAADFYAQVLQGWVNQVEAVAQRVKDGETWEGQPADALEIAERMAKRFQKDILRQATHSLSRSTAVLGNLVEDVIASAKAEFVEYATGGNIWG